MVAARLLIKQRYEVEERSRSGMSHVYEGIDIQTDRAVIVKAVPTSDFTAAAVLVKERETLVRLRHEGIVKCLEVVEEDGLTCLVLEKVEGSDLGELLRLGDLNVDEATARDWAIQLAGILAYLHAQAPPIIYRDMKPANIMLRPDGRLVLVDFGATRVLSNVVKDTVALGTPGYAPPEQYAAATDERADIYALGATLHELLTRRDPIHFNFRLPPPGELGMRLSRRFEATLMRMLDPDPARRYQSIKALLRDLEPQQLSALPFLAAAAAVGVGLLPIPPLGRYALDVVLCGVAAASVARSVRPLIFLAWLAAVPLFVQGPDLASWLRRFSLELGVPSVELGGSPDAWTALGLWLVALGWAVGFACTRQRAWHIPLMVLLLGAACSVLPGKLQRPGASAETAQAPALWTQTLGPSRMRRVQTYHRPGALAVRTGLDGLVVLNPENGRVLWSADCSGTMPLGGVGDSLIHAMDRRVLARDIRDGTVQWQFQMPAPIKDMWFPMGPAFVPGLPETIYVRCTDGSVAALSPGRPAPLWVWRGPSEAQMLARCQDVVLVVSRNPSELHALRASDGQLAWKRSIERNDAHRFFQAAGRWCWITGDGIEAIDVSTGHTVYHWTLPVGLGGPDRAEFLDAFPSKDARVMVAGRDTLFQIDAESGATLLRTSLPGESASLRAFGFGQSVFYLRTRSGRIIGLEARSGRATYEWSESPGLEWEQAFGGCHLLQAAGASVIRAFEPETGHVYTWRTLPAGMRVQEVLASFGRLFVIGVNGSQQVEVQSVPAGRLDPMGGMR